MWPRKISMFGKGTGKLETPTPLQERLEAAARGSFTLVDPNKREEKRLFMQEAVLAMLHTPVTSPPRHLVDRAEELYNLIEDTVQHDA